MSRSMTMTLSPPVPRKLRRLVVVCGDQLDSRAAVLAGLDPAQDALLMTEAAEEATYLPQHKRRVAFFFAAMRHFAEDRIRDGLPVIYWRLDDPAAPESLGAALRQAIDVHAPHAVEMTRPGDHRVRSALQTAAAAAGAELREVEDTHFLSTDARFEELRAGRKRFILEDFYRAERKRLGWLMDGDAPVGGQWNFDKDNRKAFGRAGPGLTPARARFAPDEITREALAMVAERFQDAPGSLDDFEEPVSAADAEAALADFVANRLPLFGDYQDALAGGQRTLYHSRLSAVINVKLLSPARACEAAIAAFETGAAPLNAVEGFVRQILGWREFVRGVYWAEGPSYGARNVLGAERDTPSFLWTAETDMACVRDAVEGLLAQGYAHHIERLMVLGLYQLLLGVHPYRAHEWHMSLYLDAVDWVSLPNVLGMSQHADGGVVGTKPYAASGAYIDRMSDHCRGCRYDPKSATGDAACPFTTLYWDFLARHQNRFAGTPRMRNHYANLRRKDPDEVSAIRAQAARL